MSLYQKYRPQSFADVVGQEAIKKTLANAIAYDQVNHAYLFVGPRGTGKTTTARLLAKAINCEKRKKGEFEPCNTCSSCKEIMQGQSLDVIEIDAASNRGIDDVRELRDKIRYAPTKAKFKIYIIDEVHMLTKESFNALLKTLEEPPKHAIFIMATTEPDKVLDTIISRVQEFDFKRATQDEVNESLTRIIDKEKINIDDQSKQLLSEMADGSFRDAVSMLDQINTQGEKITLAQVEKSLGIVEHKVIENFLENIIENKPKKAVEIIENIYDQGFDLNIFLERLMQYLRYLLLTINGLLPKSKMDKQSIEVIKKITKQLDKNKLLAMINIFLQVGKDMKYAKIPQLPLEIAVFDLTREDSVENIDQKEIEIEKDIIVKDNLPEKKIIEKKEKIKIKKIDQSKEENKVKINEKPGKVVSSNKAINTKETWQKLLKSLETKNHPLALLLKDSKPVEIKNGIFYISVKFKFYAERINDGKKHELICQTLEEITQEKLKIECVVDETPPEEKDIPEKTNNELLDNAMEIFN